MGLPVKRTGSQDASADARPAGSRRTARSPGTRVIMCSESAARLCGPLWLCHFSSFQLDWMYPKNNLQPWSNPPTPFQNQVTESAEGVEWSRPIPFHPRTPSPATPAPPPQHRPSTVCRLTANQDLAPLLWWESRCRLTRMKDLVC